MCSYFIVIQSRIGGHKSGWVMRRLVEEAVKKGRDSLVGRSTGVLRRPEAMATDRELLFFFGKNL